MVEFTTMGHEALLATSPIPDLTEDLVRIKKNQPPHPTSLEDHLVHVYKAVMKEVDTTSSGFGQIRIGLLEIATAGTLDGKNIEYSCPGRRSYDDNSSKRSELMWIYSQDPDLARSIVEKQIVGFHGSVSGAILPVLDNGLVPLATLRAKDELVVSGERTVFGNIQDTTSFVQWFVTYDLRSYARQEEEITVASLQKNIEKLEAEQKKRLKAKRVHDRAHFNQVIQNANDYINELKALQEYLQIPPQTDEERLSHTLIRENFPVVYGITMDGIDPDTTHIPNSHFYGEFVISGGAPRKNIQMVLVPKPKVAFMKDLIAQKGLDIPVFPLEGLLN